MKILAAEDTPSLRALLQTSLERAGHQVDVTGDGREALERFSSGDYDAVVLDLQMPVMDGLEAARRMRADELSRGRKPAPILALTAGTEGADLRRCCLEAGFTSTLRKPFHPKELISAIESATKEAAAPGPSARPGPDIPVEIDPDFADLIAPFLSNCRDESAAMRAALARGDFAAVAASSHKLIGAGASFGFKPLSDESRLIEGAAKSGDAAGVLARLDAIDSYLSRVKVIHA